MTVAPGLKKWLAFGAGVGIEIVGAPGAESLRVAAVRVRPGGARAIASLAVDDVLQQGAGAWGQDYSRFLRKHGLSSLPATVILPRREVTVRLLTLPGVSDKDLASAVEFQLDGLHPYAESDAVCTWARVPGTPTVLVAVTRRSAVERYATLFAEAGVKTASFTCSAAAVYSARHVFGETGDLLTYEDTGHGFEIYGESVSRPVFSSFFGTSLDRAVPLAAAEMRLEIADADPVSFAKPLEQVLGASPALPYAAAVASACPHLALGLNFLPEALRSRSSRFVWVPTAALASVVLILAGALGAFPRYEKGRHLKALEAEIAKVEPIAARSAALDRQIEEARRRIILLDGLRARPRADMDVLNEMTHILPPPTWVNLFELDRTQVTVAGETPQTAPLLQTIDESPVFEASEFAQPPVRLSSGAGEAFRIRAKREAGK
jgi:hypothetical protein